jgi:UDP-sulfoquinovose synthase
MHLAKRGHIVSVVDNFSRRANMKSIGSHSATPILDMEERLSAFKRIHSQNLSFFEGDLLDYDFLAEIIKQTCPDSIVHLAEQPSAVKYSKKNSKAMGHYYLRKMDYFDYE